MRKTRQKIEIGQLRLWTESVWQEKIFLVVDRFVSYEVKMLKILQNNQHVVVSESAVYNMSKIIEDT